MGEQPFVMIGSKKYAAQLLVGSLVWDDESMESVMGAEPEAAEGDAAEGDA